MQSPFVQIPVDGRGKEDDCCTLAGGYLDVHRREIGLSALDAIVEVYQNGHNSLTTVLGKTPSVFVTEVKGVKVLLYGGENMGNISRTHFVVSKMTNNKKHNKIVEVFKKNFISLFF